jgi:two-component system OmpR family sensor kinase
MHKLTISLLIVVIVTSAGLGWFFDNIHDRFSSEENTQKVSAIDVLEQIGKSLAYAFSQVPNRELFIKSWPTDGSYQLEIIPMAELPMPQQLVDDIRLGKPLTLETNKHLVLHFYLASSEELLILKSPRLKVTQPGELRDYILTSIFYVALLLLFFLWVYPLIRQLSVLRQTAKSFGEGNLDDRISVSSRSYIRDIETEFNHMAQRIESLVKDVKLLSSAVSHDLRTPLARIRIGLDTLREENDPLVRRRFEDKIDANMDEMTSLVETLLTYARLDQTMVGLSNEKISLNEVIKNCMKTKMSEVINLELKLPDADCAVYGDSRYLSMLVNNLVQNAIQYSNGHVCVQLLEIPTEIILTVSDNGGGVEKELKEHIFKPFVRGNHKGKAKNNHGIGLATVKRILDWHQGHIQINTSQRLGGAKFVVSFPKVKK